MPANTRRRQTVQQALTARAWARSFSRGLSAQGILDYLHIWHLVANIQLSQEANRTVWRWTANGEYTAESAYKMLHARSAKLAGPNLVWKTWAPLKVRIFLWLFLRRRHWTADRRR